MRKSLPLVSILMPVKNAGVFLAPCLDSIISQTWIEWELIAVNDHSVDLSAAILQQYGELDARITVLENQGTGIISALRHAFDHSSGHFVTRMDADDIMAKDKLGLMVDALQNVKNGLAIGLVEYFNEQGLGEGYRKYADWLNNLTREKLNFSEIYRECVVPSPCWMTSRENLDLCGSFDSPLYPEDYDLAFRFKKAKLKIVPVDQVIHYWRDHPSRTSRNDENYSDNQFSNLKITHFLDQEYDTDKNLILWGAGKRAKKLAKLLVSRAIPFEWLTNNESKQGQQIYGISLKSENRMKDIVAGQVIIAISSPDEESHLQHIISLLSHLNFYRFA